MNPQTDTMPLTLESRFQKAEFDRQTQNGSRKRATIFSLFSLPHGQNQRRSFVGSPRVVPIATLICGAVFLFGSPAVAQSKIDKTDDAKPAYSGKSYQAHLDYYADWMTYGKARFERFSKLPPETKERLLDCFDVYIDFRSKYPFNDPPGFDDFDYSSPRLYEMVQRFKQDKLPGQDELSEALLLVFEFESNTKIDYRSTNTKSNRIVALLKNLDQSLPGELRVLIEGSVTRRPSSLGADEAIYISRQHADSLLDWFQDSRLEPEADSVRYILVHNYFDMLRLWKFYSRRETGKETVYYHDKIPVAEILQKIQDELPERNLSPWLEQMVLAEIANTKARWAKEQPVQLHAAIEDYRKHLLAAFEIAPSRPESATKLMKVPGEDRDEWFQKAVAITPDYPPAYKIDYLQDLARQSLETFSKLSSTREFATLLPEIALKFQITAMRKVKPAADNHQDRIQLIEDAVTLAQAVRQNGTVFGKFTVEDYQAACFASAWQLGEVERAMEILEMFDGQIETSTIHRHMGVHYQLIREQIRKRNGSPDPLLSSDEDIQAVELALRNGPSATEAADLKARIEQLRNSRPEIAEKLEPLSQIVETLIRFHADEEVALEFTPSLSRWLQRGGTFKVLNESSVEASADDGAMNLEYRATFPTPYRIEFDVRSARGDKVSSKNFYAGITLGEMSDDQGNLGACRSFVIDRPHETMKTRSAGGMIDEFRSQIWENRNPVVDVYDNHFELFFRKKGSDRPVLELARKQERFAQGPLSIGTTPWGNHDGRAVLSNFRVKKITPEFDRTDQPVEFFRQRWRATHQHRVKEYRKWPSQGRPSLVLADHLVFSARQNEDPLVVVKSLELILKSELKPQHKCKYLCELAVAEHRRKKTKRALEHLDEAERIVEKTDTKYKQWLPFSRAWILATAKDDSLRDSESAAKLIEDARPSYDFPKEFRSQILAALAANAGNYSEAVGHIDEALEIWDKKYFETAHNNAGVIYDLTKQSMQFTLMLPKDPDVALHNELLKMKAQFEASKPWRK